MIQFDRTSEDGRLIGEWVHIPQGYYSDAQDLINKINSAFTTFGTNRGLGQIPQLRLDKYTNRISIQIMKGMRINFSNCLKLLLGVDKTDDIHTNESVSTVTLTNACDLDRNYQSIYVYCDILEQTFVGDTKAPLLRNIGVLGKHGATIRKVFDKPMYVPIQKKHFDSIEIDIRSDFGDSMPFMNGKSLMILHFRMSKNPYFLQ